ncbi:hypothetical protein FKM82_006476 [Ascaphus truei]
MGNGMNKILPGLFIGNFKDARDIEKLHKNNITHILSIHDSARPMLEKTQHFKDSTAFIHECRLKGEGCLVHCLAGVSRSVTLVVAYVMAITDFGWEDALSAVRGARTCANPNMGFQKQLEDFGKHDVQHFRTWLKETYGESPFLDEEDAKQLLAKDKQHEAESQSNGSSGRQWTSHLTSLSSMSYSTTET